MSPIYILAVYVLTSWTFCILLHQGNYIGQKNSSLIPIKFIFYTLPAFTIGFYFIALKPFDAGGDTSHYLESFSYIKNPFTATSDADFGTEVLFWPIQALLKLAFDARGWLIAHFLIISALNFIAYKKLLENTKITSLLFSLPFLSYFIVYDANAMRQAYAIPLSMLAFYYSYRRESLKFLAFSLISISFHWSSIIILIAPIANKIPHKPKYYITLPILALALSSLISPMVDGIANLFGFQWLLTKSNAYIDGNYKSHLDNILLSLNFWLCICTYMLTITLGTAKRQEYEKITKLLLIFICIILFSIKHVDIADRYLVNILFLIPIAITISLLNIKLSNLIRNLIVSLTMLAMGGLVYTSPPLMSALGIRY